jgi:hypothetical protein
MEILGPRLIYHNMADFFGNPDGRPNAQEPHPAARHGALAFVMWDMSRHKSMDAL